MQGTRRFFDSRFEFTTALPFPTNIIITNYQALFVWNNQTKEGEIMAFMNSKKYCSRHQSQHLSGAIVASLCLGSGRAFSNQQITRAPGRPSKQCTLLFMSDEWKDTANDSNLWRSSNDVYEEKEDWREMLARKNDGSFWSEFEPSAEGEEASSAIIDTETEDIDDADIWLDTLASISADEIEFNVCNKFVYSVLSFFLKLSGVGN